MVAGWYHGKRGNLRRWSHIPREGDRKLFMAPRWWDWTILAVVVAAGALWLDLTAPELWTDTAPLAGVSPPPAVPPAEPRLPPEPIRPSSGAVPVDASPPPNVVAPPNVVTPLPNVIRPTNPSQPFALSGAGFFIANDGSILTVAHLVRNCQKLVISSRYLPATPVRLLALDSASDVAVLQARSVHPPGVLALADRPSSAIGLAIFGYPGGGGTLIPTQIRAVLRTERPAPDDSDKRDLIWAESSGIANGFSGGPILNPAGGVIGMVSGHITRRFMARDVLVREISYAFGASTRAIMTFLTQDIPTLIPETGPPPDTVDKAIVRVVCLP